MSALAAGQMVLAPFPFSDLTGNKPRPALLMADAGRGDWIACQITINRYSDPHAITPVADGFEDGGLMILNSGVN